MSFLAGGLRVGSSRAVPRANALVVLLALALATAPAVVVPAAASAAAGRPPIGGVGQTPGAGGGTRAGLRSAAPTGQALAGALDQMTGLTPSQVQLQDV